MALGQTRTLKAYTHATNKKKKKKKRKIWKKNDEALKDNDMVYKKN